ncbi:MAG: hypothetical protein GTO41_11425, partial [Burkholderiales bacterium]|nr:hypothetical protein [Burkholderiales bacterium]
MNTIRNYLAVALTIVVVLIGSQSPMAAEKKENLTFVAIATEEMAVVTERWQPAI